MPSCGRGLSSCGRLKSHPRRRFVAPLRLALPLRPDLNGPNGLRSDATLRFMASAYHPGAIASQNRDPSGIF